jgi:N-acetyl sugar amidotransferase
MIKIKNPPELDLSKYIPIQNSPQIMYGLPEEILFCNSCSYSNQKPNSEREITHQITSNKPTVTFNESGICSACQIAEVKKKIDWQEREKMLQDLCNKYRKSNGEYDCIVPGSGGKDSFYTSYILKYKYNMNPLTVTWAPHIYTPWGWDNFQSWIHSGFDNHLLTPNGRVHRLLTRLALEKIFHPFQPFIMGQMYMPPRMALQLDIPLVVYGENPVEYGNTQSSFLTSPKKDATYFTSQQKESTYISGTSTVELIEDFGLSATDLEPYLPLDSSRYNESKLDVQYLGYYLPWHPQDLYYFAVENGGFKASPERNSGTYSKYSSIDDKIDDFHYYCTYIKFGIGRATYDSAQEIRNGEIERDEAISLIKRYDGEYPSRFEKECLAYLSLPSAQFPIASSRFETSIIDSQYFERLTNKFRSPHLWQISDNGWELRKSIFSSVSEFSTSEGEKND